MKIKATVTINLGLYMDIRPEIEIEVPDGLKNQKLVEYLHDTYKGILVAREVGKSKVERKEDAKNSAELSLSHEDENN